MNSTFFTTSTPIPSPIPPEHPVIITEISDFEKIFSLSSSCFEAQRKNDFFVNQIIGAVHTYAKNETVNVTVDNRYSTIERK